MIVQKDFQTSNFGLVIAETIQSLALALESVDDIHSGDSLALSMLSVGNSITDDALKENLEDCASLLINEARDTLHTSTASKTANGRLGDALDVVTKDLAMALSTTLAKTLAAFSTSSCSNRHCSMEFELNTRKFRL